MTSRRAGKSADAIALFPFLAVLLCTMGGLLVLLVVLSEAAKRRGERIEPAVAAESADDAARRVAMVVELRELEAAQAKLAELREQAAEKLRNEQARLSHSEQQQRQLEHELAKLHVAATQLEAAEQNQSVDRDQASTELVRLRQLIQENEEQLKKLREEGAAPKSYAIIPYKGENGTLRRPIYLECGADEVIIQPEGIRLTVEDFVMAGRAGNPLASALRAAREQLNAEARRAGVQPLPEAYPLLLIRPDGADAYFVVMKAIRAWDGDLGYEFIDADANLKFDPPDPVLAEAMNHAVMQARDRMRILAEAAPSRFSVSLAGSGSGGAGRGGSGFGGGEGDGYGPGKGSGGNFTDGDNIALGTGAFNREVEFAERLAGGSSPGSGGAQGQAAGGSTTLSGNALPEGANPSGANSPTEPSGARIGMLSEGNSGGGQGTGKFASAQGTAGQAGGQSGDQPGGQTGGSSAAASASGASQSASAGQTASGSGASSSMSASNAAAGMTGGPSGSATVSGGDAATPSATIPLKSGEDSARAQSLAKTRGIDWALNLASRKASPISRPIQAVVRKDSITVLPSRYADPAADPAGAEVRLDQPTEKAVDDLVDALRSQIKTWGLAGQGLYWKPTLVVAVAPGAEPNARKLAQLLEGSGIDVKLPETASRSSAVGGASHATR